MCVQVGGCVGFCERYNCSACAGAYVRKLELAFSLTLMTASDSPTSSVMIPAGVCTKICFGLYLRNSVICVMQSWTAFWVSESVQRGESNDGSSFLIYSWSLSKPSRLLGKGPIRALGKGPIRARGQKLRPSPSHILLTLCFAFWIPAGATCPVIVVKHNETW